MQAQLVQALYPNHAVAIRSLAYSIWRQHFPGVISNEQIEYMLGKFYTIPNILKKIRGGEAFYLVRVGEEYVGFFSYTLEPEKKSAQLNKLFLEQKVRGNRIASMAVSELVRKCREAGIGRVWLAVNRNNNDSIAAWGKLGFKIIREEAFDIGSGFVMDDYIMERRL